MQMPRDKHPEFIAHSLDPLNGGPPPQLICRSEVTPSELFFVRNHGTIPAIDLADYRLAIGGMVTHTLAFTLEELRTRFRKVDITVTLECAGNRRDELIAIEPIPGELAWGLDAIGNASWAGVALSDLLLAAGLAPGAAHVAFTGLDQVTRQGRCFGFGGSLPLEKALGSEVILAYEMNGAPLPATHGFPLRVIAPGYIGARSVKWLAALTVQAEPSDNYFQAHAYKLFPPHVRDATVDWAGGRMLGELALNTVICTPSAGARLPAGTLAVAGYALASGGRSIEHVEISADGGASWRRATLLGEPQPWVWRLWQAELELPHGTHQLIARACDTAGNTQPEDMRALWNFKGYMNNAWHRVEVLTE